MVEGMVADISRALIQAQEEERARIARELHDDINQRLALLAIGIEQVGEGLPPQVHSRLKKLQQQVTEISTDIHAMAHELHCSSLDYLGLVPAVRKLARELGRRQDIEIEVKDDGVPKHLPSEISLCLFRIIQEALHNAAKHSGAKRFEVHLHKMADQIHVTLRDSGKGFDIEAVRNGKGLGLASMQERISMVKGKIMIRSEQAVGTSIQAWVPLQTNASHAPQIADRSVHQYRLHFGQS
jgi:signal transduction histidine kinase